MTPGSPGKAYSLAAMLASFLRGGPIRLPSRDVAPRTDWSCRPRDPARARSRKVIRRIAAYRRRRDLLNRVHLKETRNPKSIAYQVRHGLLTAEEIALFN